MSDVIGKDAANIQGALHLDGYLSRRKKKKDQVDKAAGKTLYVHRPVINATQIIAWAKAQGFVVTIAPEDMHVTIAFSRTQFDWALVAPQPDNLLVPPAQAGLGARGLVRQGQNLDCVVLRFESPELNGRWQELRNLGASWDWPDYHPHVTVSWQPPAGIEAIASPFLGEILLGPEIFAEVKENWKDTIVEKSDQKITKVDARIAKTDDKLGLVFGYAIVCKIDGEDYYDLNIDDDGERVPEHIPEHTMLKAAANFMESARVGNLMHRGDDLGKYVFAYPLTSDIAKSLGIEAPMTGLLVAFKPPADVYEMYKSGELTGFSIEGRRLKYENVKE